MPARPPAPRSRAPRAPFALLAALALLGAAPARAGGGPENVFVVVNPSSQKSLAVANAWIAVRGIPAINVLMLPWEGSLESVPIGRFREEILRPILAAIDGRRLTAQIDQVVYSADFPWRIDFADELPPVLVGKDLYPSGSLTGLTFHYAAVMAGQATYLERAANRYWRPLDGEGVPQATQGFRGWYGWGSSGEIIEAGGPRYLLATMLGVSDGAGNGVDEIVAGLVSAAGADGRRPRGTIFFAENGDVRSKTRAGAFAAAVRELTRVGVKAEVFQGVLPPDRKDVAGLMKGTPKFDWSRSGSTVVPGAICENLTSYGGIFTPGSGQTPLSEFIRAGAAGSSGTVIEPYALQEKFPHPSIQVHYARGATLAEAFYQSLQIPYQLLVVGDPLCQPWAAIPLVEAVTADDGRALEGGRVLTGTVSIEPTARLAEPDAASAPVDRFEMFVDGIRSGQCAAGERLALDTAALSDGHHELRVVGIRGDSVETQGRLVVPFAASNHGRSLTLTVQPETVELDGTLRVSVAGRSIEGVTLFCNGRVIGRTAGQQATVEIPADVLGAGRVQIRAIGRAGTGASSAVSAAPVTVDVRPPK
jgi:hypothetical protein